MYNLFKRNKNLALIVILHTMMGFSDFLAAQNAAADTTNVRFMLYGRVRTKRDANPIPFAHVIKMRERLGLVTDSTGRFKTMVNSNEILRISAIGYKPAMVSAKEAKEIENHDIVIYLTDTTYQLNEVNVYTWRWLDLQYKMTQDMPVLDKGIKERIQEYILPEEIQSLVNSSGVPGFYLNLQSKAEKQKKIVKELEEEFRLSYRADSLVLTLSKRETQLPGNDLETFIKDLNLKEIEILSMTEYQLLERINQQYKIYKEALLKQVPKK